MKFNLTLTRRYVLYLAGIIAVLLVGSLFVTSTVVRTSFTDLFEQRLSKCSDVLDQYTNLQHLQSLRKLEAVLTSPRFLAAVSTGDSGTVHRETPTYKGILAADFLLIVNDNNKVIYLSKYLTDTDMKELSEYVEEDRPGKYVEYAEIHGKVHEILVSEIITNDGFYLGKLIAGTQFSETITTDLGNLTGFEVLFTKDRKILGMTDSRLTEHVASHDQFISVELAHKNKIELTDLDGEEIVHLTLPSNYANASVTFVGSLDESISPIMNKVRVFLLLMTLIGGFAALFAIYVFTKKRIGKQVDLLVAAAEHIAAGDMDFKIRAASNDEFGYLAGEFEVMRARLVSGRKELEKAHEEKLASERLATTGKFVAGIIHDLKNPLAIIRSSTELLQYKGAADEKVAKHCQSINMQIDRMVDLTRDVLDFCRGKINLELRLCNLSEFFDQVMNYHEPNFRKSGITLQLDKRDEIQVNLDTGRFRRVIDNLLNNAREALKPGDKVTIKWKIDQDKLDISVSDNGPGIPQDIRQSLFQPFVTSGKEHGTGLGLSVARKIIEDHGAGMTFESDTNVGTTFKIRLPIQLVVSGSRELATAL